MLERLYALVKYIFDQFHHNIMLIVVFMFSVIYYSLSVYINSAHEFDTVLSSVLYDNVLLSNYNGLAQIAKQSKHYQINTIAVLYKINHDIKNKNYEEAIKLLVQIIIQYNDVPIIKDMFLVRRALISILLYDNIEDYTKHISRDNRYTDKRKLYLISVAKKYYKNNSSK